MTPSPEISLQGRRVLVTATPMHARSPRLPVALPPLASIAPTPRTVRGYLARATSSSPPGPYGGATAAGGRSGTPWQPQARRNP